VYPPLLPVWCHQQRMRRGTAEPPSRTATRSRHALRQRRHRCQLPPPTALVPRPALPVQLRISPASRSCCPLRSPQQRIPASLFLPLQETVWQLPPARQLPQTVPGARPRRSGSDLRASGRLCLPPRAELPCPRCCPAAREAAEGEDAGWQAWRGHNAPHARTSCLGAGKPGEPTRGSRVPYETDRPPPDQTLQAAPEDFQEQTRLLPAASTLSYGQTPPPAPTWAALCQRHRPQGSLGAAELPKEAKSRPRSPPRGWLHPTAFGEGLHLGGAPGAGRGSVPHRQPIAGGRGSPDGRDHPGGRRPWGGGTPARAREPLRVPDKDAATRWTRKESSAPAAGQDAADESHGCSQQAARDGKGCWSGDPADTCGVLRADPHTRGRGVRPTHKHLSGHRLPVSVPGQPGADGSAVPILLPGCGDTEAGSELMLGPCCWVRTRPVTHGAGKGGQLPQTATAW